MAEMQVISREVNLGEYLPPPVCNAEEFKALTEAENPEFNLILERLKEAYGELFILTAEGWGLEIWEEALGITPESTEKDEDSLRQRRAEILSRLYIGKPYTFRRVYEILAELCGGEDYVGMKYADSAYSLDVLLSLKVKNLKKTILELLRKITPANIALEADLDYNTHGRLGRLLTHGEMESFTHGELFDKYIEGSVLGEKY